MGKKNLKPTGKQSTKCLCLKETTKIYSQEKETWIKAGDSEDNEFRC